MMLGRNHGHPASGPIWACAKWLDLCPVGTVVRNGCDHLAPAGEGTHMRKVKFRGEPEWVPCNPQGAWRIPDDWPMQIQAKDVFLPVQVVIRGRAEDD